MIFGIDVRRTVCTEDRKYIEIVELKTSIDLLAEREEDEELKEAFMKVAKELEVCEDIQHKIYKEAISNLEKEFVKDIFENRDFYEYKLNNEEA